MCIYIYIYIYVHIIYIYTYIYIYIYIYMGLVEAVQRAALREAASRWFKFNS